MAQSRTKSKKDSTQTPSKKESTHPNGVEYKPGHNRVPLFEYPALPRLEILLYFIYLIGFLSWGWYRIFVLSQNYVWGKGGYSIKSQLPLFGNRSKDVTNYEWLRYRPWSLKIIPLYAVHCLIFNLLEKVLGPTYKSLWELLTTGYSIIACCWLIDTFSVFTCLASGMLLFSATRLTRSKYVIWISTVICLWMLLRGWFVIGATPEYKRLFYYIAMMNGYNLLCFISYNLEYIDGRTRPEDASFLKGLFRMFYYAFYMPYLVSVIVIYPEFERQMAQRSTQTRNWKTIVFFGLRITFLHLFTDFVLHFFYFESILHDRQVLYSVPLDTLAALGYAIGQFFHLKYAVIFGVPSLFAKIDGMEPADPPICITRVNLYSKIWREFDRGLYAFFKEYIHLVIIRPTFSIQRKLFGIILSYSFVLIWHGAQRNNVVWIVLNIVSLFMETFGRAIYSIASIRTWREKHISDRNFRRILAWLQIAPFAFSLFSIFYFLAGSKAGYVFVDRYFWGEIAPLRYPFGLLLILGYTHSNVCMEIERYYTARKQKLQ